MLAHQGERKFHAERGAAPPAPCMRGGAGQWALHGLVQFWHILSNRLFKNGTWCLATLTGGSEIALQRRLVCAGAITAL
jgi:hypothetical protein